MWQSHGSMMGNLGPGQAGGGPFGAGPGQGPDSLQIDVGFPVYDNFLVPGSRQQTHQGAKQHGAPRRPDRGSSGEFARQSFGRPAGRKRGLPSEQLHVYPKQGDVRRTTAGYGSRSRLWAGGIV
jgi:hypothetical protein